MHKALVEAQGGISGELHASFQGMLLAMQDVPAVLIVLADSLQVGSFAWLLWQFLDGTTSRMLTHCTRC